ncbi:HEPN domain-containing protein [Acidobacteria bacterium AH-259-A15]|nr:HEPN domain-containing protein [Acidobacteria bacterium AH-259-A15]
MQAVHDLGHAENAFEDSDFDWACFAAQQSAEKALKGLFLALGGEAWGHSVTRLLQDLTAQLIIPPEVNQAARRLDKHYIPARYPNGFDSGPSYEYYTAEDAKQAISDARRIYDFCQQSIR